MSPKLFKLIRENNISKEQIIKDVVAGIIVAIIALPLSIALGISSGVSPEKGLITAIVGGFIISLLGGSRVQIGGPTGAFVVIVYGIIQGYGINGLIIATLMAGIILILMGILKLGSVIKYVPTTITVGFTSGIAITLLSTQIKDLFGLNIANVPADFIPKWKVYFSNMNTINLPTLIVGLSCIFIIVIWPKINKTIPGSLVALIMATLVVNVFNLPVETIGSRFQNISSTIPIPHLVSIDLSTIKDLFKPALTIAILAAVESLLSAVVADGMCGSKHDSNMELVAQGVANVGSALFGGIPVTGAIARTAANIKSGGRTPISGIIHAIILFLIMLLFMPFAKLIPMTTLAAILVVVSYNMSGWRSFKALLKAPKSDVMVLLLTFFLTVIFDLVMAIEIGMIVAMFLFMKKIADTTRIRDLANEDVLDENLSEMLDNANDKILVYQVNGPLFFGIVQNFMNVMDEVKPSAEVLILDMRHAHSIDASAIEALNTLLERCQKYNIKLILTHVNKYPMKILKNMNFIDKLGKRYIYETKTQAINASYKYITELGM
ncbi:sulfate permease, SulP family [Clostridium cavendishii DSM 21758]|uniref:Sulfate permease, SulP family n=1 Tax=Clostridium cavendishii DSM 21758 TaxID=1121302 RepID=A0A1M6I3E8_9CLOT|nr:sulfate permease [Clostridium cavendishii]SHJ29011.1 sulfate permease, SulP family [Clostridium cavendishii DSM 21758]